MENIIKHGEELFGEGKIEEAENCFLEILEQDPQNKEAYNNLGVISFQNQHIEKALDYFNKSLKLDPFYKESVLNYAHLLKELNLFYQAIPLLEQIAERYPEDEEINQILDHAHKARSHPEPSPDSLSCKTVLKPREFDLASSEKKFSGTKEDPLAGKKILHTPFEIAGNMDRITKYLNRQDVAATSVNYYDSWLKYKCDLNLNINSLPENKRIYAIDQFARDAIERYDIFHFHFAHSLYPDFRDLERLKEKGKKIIFHFWGSDQRGPEWIFYNQAKFLGYDPPKPYTFTLDLYNKHKTINRYADVLIGAYAIPRGIFIAGIAELSAWSLEEKARILDKKAIDKDPQKTYFVHAPSCYWKKGTTIILELFNQCKQEGMPIELLYVNQLPTDQAREIYAFADFALEQVGPGTFGLFGIEMMCWEIPVLVYHTPLLDRIRDNPPVIKITKETFKNQIAKCVEMKRTHECEKIGKRSRRWAHQHLDISSGIHNYLAIYRALLEGGQVKQYVNKVWYQQEHMLQSGFKSDFYRYMIEEGVFEELNINIGDYDQRLYY